MELSDSRLPKSLGTLNSEIYLEAQYSVRQEGSLNPRGLRSVLRGGGLQELSGEDLYLPPTVLHTSEIYELLQILLTHARH